MKTKPDLFWLVNRETAITLTRKGLVPSYLAQLWAMTHHGITPLWWKVLDKVINCLCMLLGLLVAVRGLMMIDQYHSLNNSNLTQMIGLIWLAFVFFAFIIGKAYFGVFNKLTRNWKSFNGSFRELAREFYLDNALPETVDEFIARIHKALVRRACHQLKEKIKEDWQSAYRLREIYDAAKEFGILKWVGYGPYFVEARAQLDEEEMPLFHRK